MLSRDDRRQFRQKQFADRQQVPLSLQHAREFREISLEPGLLFVAQGRFLQIANHLVDVVLDERDLTLRVDLN